MNDALPVAIPDVRSAQLLLQSVQAPAAGYWNMLADQTVPQIRKAQRVEQAFEQVLDDPGAAQALENPVLKPLLEEAAD